MVEDAPLAVVQVSTQAMGGGADRVARLLHEGLRARGHRSWMAVRTRNIDDPDIVALPTTATPRPIAAGVRALASGAARLRGKVPWAGRARRFLDDAAISFENAVALRRGREPFDYPGSRRLLRLLPGRPDVVHAHNLHGRYFDLRALPALSRAVPVALTLHDEWTYTGHCAYTMGLERWREGCHSCPDRAIYPAIARDATHANWLAKRDIYRSSRLYVSAPSAWLLERARASILAEGAVHLRLIPNGVDRTVFRPGDRAAARATVGLPADAHVLLFVANRLRSNEFKDVETVFAAAQSLPVRDRDRAIVAVALGDAGPTERVGNVELRFVPYERDQDRLAAWYRAADLYLHAARADNLPTTILEALASGVPVVATAVGGIPEEIRSLAGAPGAWEGASHPSESATGVLVRPGDADGMAAAAAALLDDDALRARLSDNGARDAAERFDLERQLDATIAWYREVIDDWSSLGPGR